MLTSMMLWRREDGIAAIVSLDRGGNVDVLYAARKSS